MIIADTSIWIEFLKGNGAVQTILVSAMDQQNILALECIFAELLQGVKNNREQTIIIEYWRNLPKMDELDMWIEAGIQSAVHKYFSKGIGLIDAYIIACAKKSKSKVWTLDKKLKSVLGTLEYRR